ncbi:MAG: DEAD/DEAH box helicase [Candidatus Saccharimonadales bacterium]
MPQTQRRYAYKSTRSPYAKPKARPARTRRGRGQYIDPTRFVKVAKPVEQQVYTPTHRFVDFALAPLLQANIARKGYEVPTPIQDQTIPLGLMGKDMIGIASTGTGKTAAFALPVLNQLIASRKNRALIVAPTRELAQQIEQECREMGKGGGFTGALLIGGSAYGPQLRDLRGNPQIVIGTPGRIKDHIERGTLHLDKFNIVVLDEVDRMLDMGFVADVRLLLSQLAEQRQAFYFSATMDARVSGLIRTFSPEAQTVTVASSDTTDTVHQDVVRYGGNTDKQDKLHTILIHPDTEKVIVFEETQRGVERLERELMARGFSVTSIHGGKSQGQRARALREFKTNGVKIMLATDVAARGLDVSDITHVVNYSQPQSYEDYVHRIGRAGRAGRIGFALTFVQQ